VKVILLSGGSGKRLWPMSNDSRSKQFLKVLTDADGKSVSMLQRVWAQLDSAGLQQDVYICASKAQYEMIEHQLGNIPFIEEPSRRDTFPAIALSVAYLQDMAHCSDDETIIVMPVDPFVSADFFNVIGRLEMVLASSQADMALVGVKPSKPSSKFGYIQVSASQGFNESWFDVDAFVEKPGTEQAADLISEGALWNCGIFCFRVGYLNSVLRDKDYPTKYTDLLTAFPFLPKRSFDYEVVENTKRIVVAPYDGMWDDLGSWDALSNHITEDFVGLGQSVNCSDTHVINELGIPLITAGLQNTMVVSTPDGILVADKKHAAGIKEITGSLGGRPMYEERSWGTYRVLDFQKLEDDSEVLTKMIELFPGKNLSSQKHSMRSEVWTVIQGHGELILDSKRVELTAGDVVRIHPEQWHGLRALDELKFIEVQRGQELVEEDIIRRFTTWDETIAHCAVVMA
jgi:mannose-1-phosphate guanylyltransferase